MNRISQIIVIILVITVLLGGVVYAVTQIYKQFNTNHNITINGAFQSTLDENTINNLWVGTLDLAWKELEERIGLDKIELEDGELQLVNDLNESTFSKDIQDNKATSDCFAVKLKTQEGDEIILYRTDESKSFDEYYDDIEAKSTEYKGRTEFTEDDELRVPYVRVNGMISYTNLYEKFIKNTEWIYFDNVIQDVNFYLNEKGCNLTSNSTIVYRLQCN